MPSVSFLRIRFCLLLAVAGTAALAVGCGGSPVASNPAAPTSIAEPGAGVVGIRSAPDAVFVGAGDIAVCGPGSEATARLLDRVPGSVFTLGDNVYPSGTAEQFARCYDPTWGRNRHRTFPGVGNHDWEISAGAPYFAYFGGAAGSGAGYYSFDLGAWHVLSLNSNIPARPGSAQYDWVRRDLAANPAPCTLALWHHPLFNSGHYGNAAEMSEMWRLLDDAGADVVLAGHEHAYERFAPQTADGRFDPRGMREFIVGTGGAPLFAATSVQPNSEARNSDAWGVLKLTLQSAGYRWEFLPVDGASYRDAGQDACH